jgi:hypothetical protein
MLDLNSKRIVYDISYFSKKEVCGANDRFDAGYHLSDGVTIRRNISKAPYSTMKVSRQQKRYFMALEPI